MDSKVYVLGHDFGYGQEEEKPAIKLELRNIEDVKVYVQDVLNNCFSLIMENGVMVFQEENVAVKVHISEV